jgi:hypothetical protein
VSETTVYAIIDDSEDSMGCSCCKSTTTERILAMYFNQEDAILELKNLAKQDEESGYKIKWENDEEGHSLEMSFQSLDENGHCVHEFTINALGVK